MLFPRVQRLCCGTRRTFAGRLEWWAVVVMLAFSILATLAAGWLMDISCEDGDDYERGADELSRTQAGDFCPSIKWGLLVLMLGLQFFIGASCMTMAVSSGSCTPPCHWVEWRQSAARVAVFRSLGVAPS